MSNQDPHAPPQVTTRKAAAVLGLGYGLEHLLADQKKLVDSKIQHPYLVHLSRMPSSKRDITEKFINEMKDVQVVYVHHDIPGQRVSYKYLGGKPIHEEDYSAG